MLELRLLPPLGDRTLPRLCHLMHRIFCVSALRLNLTDVWANADPILDSWTSLFQHVAPNTDWKRIKKGATKCKQMQKNANTARKLKIEFFTKASFFPATPTYQNPININPGPLLCKVS